MWKKNFNQQTGIILYLVFSACVPMASQEQFNLTELINRALEENYQLQIVRNEEEISANNNTAGNAGFLPTATLDASQSLSLENSESDYYTGDSRSGQNALGTSRNARIEVNWVVFDGFKMFARRDRLRYFEESGRYHTRYYLEQTIADLALAYYKLIREKQLRSHYRKSLAISAYRLKLEAEKMKLGTGNALLYHQAKVDFKADSLNVMNRQLVMQQLKVDINRIINRSLDADLSVQDQEMNMHDIGPKDSLIAAAVATNLTLNLAQLEELIASANRRLEAGDRYPEVRVFGDYTYSRQTSELGFVESRQSFGPRFGVAVRFNLFDGGKEKLEHTNARIRVDNAGLDKNRISQQIRSNLIKLIHQHQSYYSQYQLLRENIRSAEKSMDIARQQFELGAIDGYDFRDTQAGLLRIRNQLTHMRYALIETEIQILRMSGQLVTSIM